MTTHIALLRGINVGGNKKVAMADLRRVLGVLGYSNVVSLLQSGNIVFQGGRGATATLERRLESGAHEHLDLATDFFVRTAQEWNEIVTHNPFATAARDDPSHLVVLLLKASAGPTRVRQLQAAISGPERAEGSGRHVYLTYPAGIGDSKVTNAVIERHLGTRVTGRNWNTVQKLDALVR